MNHKGLLSIVAGTLFALTGLTGAYAKTSTVTEDDFSADKGSADTAVLMYYQASITPVPVDSLRSCFILTQSMSDNANGVLTAACMKDGKPVTTFSCLSGGKCVQEATPN